MLLENILQAKKASVWGLGYLGYTTVFKLQNAGFNVLVHDLDNRQLRAFLGGRYPNKEQRTIWSQTGYLPGLETSKVKAAIQAKDMFRGIPLHIIAIPEDRENMTQNNFTTALADLFSRYLKTAKVKPLVIFASAFVPGHIDEYFRKRLEEKKIFADKDYYLGVIFRMDWNIETFVYRNQKVPVAGFSPKSLQAICGLGKLLNMPVLPLKSIKEAEIYVNSVSVIQAMAGDFIRQLSMGYPSVDMKGLANSLFKNVTLDDCVLNMGTGGTRMTFATDYLAQGSDNPEKLTLMKEFQDVNISSVLSYAEYLIRRGYKSVTILGITYSGNQKDITLSPAVTLADHLVKKSLKVFLHDPFCSSSEIRHYVEGAKIVNFPKEIFSTNVLVLASDHNQYKYFTQAQLNAAVKKTKLIIDNYGTWSHLKFPTSIKYHQVGDGTLNLSK